MPPFSNNIKRVIVVIGAITTLFLGVLVVVFEPLTRDVVSRDELCFYCHLEWEYNPKARLSWSKPMKAAKGSDNIASCVDCHLPPGLVNSVFAYTHFLSITDLFGRVRDIKGERKGKWTPQRAKTTYRVRDRFYEYDSITCRTCHSDLRTQLESEELKEFHQSVLDEGQTCIECHYNLVHQPVDLRESGFATERSARYRADSGS